MNYLTTITAERQIPCTKDEFDAIVELLKNSKDKHGFSAEYDSKGIYLFAEETGNQSDLPQKAIDALVVLLKRAGLEYLEFGAGMFASRRAPGSSGGYYFRIYRDGAFIYQDIKWPLYDTVGDDEFRCTECGGIFDIENSVKLGGKKGDVYCEKCGDEHNPDDDEVQHDKDVKNNLYGPDQGEPR